MDYTPFCDPMQGFGIDWAWQATDSADGQVAAYDKSNSGDLKMDVGNTSINDFYCG